MSFSPANKEDNERTSLLQKQNNHSNNEHQSIDVANDDKNHSNNNNDEGAKKDGWNFDPSTKWFAIGMFLVVVILTIVFSVQAKRVADTDNNNNSPKHNYIYDECHSYRTFTLWKLWAGVSNASSPQQQQQARKCTKTLGLVRGKPFPCASSLDCHMNIPSYCLYGDPKFLVCHHHTGFCSVKTASLPVSLELPSAGVCPLFDNTTDRCGDLLGSASSAPTPPVQEALATKPVVCVTEAVCSNETKISCHALYPNKTQS